MRLLFVALMLPACVTAICPSEGPCCNNENCTAAVLNASAPVAEDADATCLSRINWCASTRGETTRTRSHPHPRAACFPRLIASSTHSETQACQLIAYEASAECGLCKPPAVTSPSTPPLAPPPSPPTPPSAPPPSAPATTFGDAIAEWRMTIFVLLVLLVLVLFIRFGEQCFAPLTPTPPPSSRAAEESTSIDSVEVVEQSPTDVEHGGAGASAPGAVPAAQTRTDIEHIVAVPESSSAVQAAVPGVCPCQILATVHVELVRTVWAATEYCACARSRIARAV